MYTLRNGKGIMPVIPVTPTESTVTGMIYSSDNETLVAVSSHHAGLVVGSTADIAKAAGILGYVVGVGDSTADSSNKFYVQPLTPFDVVTATYSTATARSTNFLLASSNLGYFFGVSNTTTVAGAKHLDPSVAGKSAGTTSALFFKLLDYSTKEQTMTGVINSSHLALS